MDIPLRIWEGSLWLCSKNECWLFIHLVSFCWIELYLNHLWEGAILLSKCHLVSSYDFDVPHQLPMYSSYLRESYSESDKFTHIGSKLFPLREASNIEEIHIARSCLLSPKLAFLWKYLTNLQVYPFSLNPVDICLISLLQVNDVQHAAFINFIKL